MGWDLHRKNQTHCKTLLRRPGLSPKPFPICCIRGRKWEQHVSSQGRGTQAPASSHPGWDSTNRSHRCREYRLLEAEVAGFLWIPGSLQIPAQGSPATRVPFPLQMNPTPPRLHVFLRENSAGFVCRDGHVLCFSVTCGISSLSSPQTSSHLIQCDGYLRGWTQVAARGLNRKGGPKMVFSPPLSDHYYHYLW